MRIYLYLFVNISQGSVYSLHRNLDDDEDDVNSKHKGISLPPMARDNFRESSSISRNSVGYYSSVYPGANDL